MPVIYKGIKLECGYRLDLLVEGRVVVEVKSVESICPVHRAQVLTYLKLGGWKVALLINFNVAVLKEGIQRLVMGLGQIAREPVPQGAVEHIGAISLHQHEHSGDTESETMATEVISCALEVHRELGPGLLASAYMACLAHELSLRNVQFAHNQPLPLYYKGMSLREADRIKLLVGGRLLVDTLAVAAVQPVHRAQLLSQLRLTGCTLGLLINFDTMSLKHGIRRMVLSRTQR